MSLKKLFQHAMLCAFCLFGWILIKEYLPFISLTILAFYLYRHTRDHTVLLFLGCCCIVSIPRCVQPTQNLEKASVIQISGRYAILQENLTRILVYTDEPLMLDACYKISGPIESPEYTSGIYRFNNKRWMQQLRISGTVDGENIHLVKVRHTPRFFLQKKIEESENKDYLYKILFNARLDQEKESFFYSNGFSYAGILSATEWLLKFKVERKRRKRIMVGFNLILAFFYHFPLILSASLIFRLLAFTSFERSEKTGIGYLILMCLYPYGIYSLSFLIPAIYRISFLWNSSKKRGCFWLVMCVQAFATQAINPIQSFFYPLLKNMLGFLWMLSFLSLILPFSIPFSWMESLFSFLDQMRISGSMKGMGLFFYLLILYTIKNKINFSLYASIWLLVFQCAGLFHPFASLSFINVGQGDAILIRAPFNQENILIDTGKPAQWKNLKTYLDGEGVHQLKALLVTHGDDDHCGNQDRVMETYKPKYLITEHQKESCFDQFCLYDLNDIENEDENESSLVSYFQMNGMYVLLTGDIDSYAEERIASKYNKIVCDVLKLSHHGSKTGNCDQFLDTLKPKTAVISSGSYSLYHHPSPEVVQRLLKRHIPYFDTKEEGDIKIVCIGPVNVLITSSGKVAIMN